MIIPRVIDMLGAPVQSPTHKNDAVLLKLPVPSEELKSRRQMLAHYILAIIKSSRRGFIAAAVLSLISCVSCGSHSQIDDTVKGFFAEVNKSNFETARVKYLYSGDASLMLGQANKTIEDSFKNLVGYIQSVEIGSEQVTGERATLTVLLVEPWGARASGKVELIKEGGRTWKISSWDAFKFLGYEHTTNAMNYCNAQNIGTALGEFQSALEENPKDALILDWMGICYERAGNLDAAQAKWKQAIGMYPDVVWDPYLRLGYIYSQTNKLDEAEKAFKKAEKNVGNEPRAAGEYNNVAWFYADHGLRLEQAIEFAQKAVALAPDNGAALDTLGWAYYKKGDRAQAVKYLAQAAEKDPSNQLIQAHYKEASTTAATHIARSQGFLSQRQFDQALSECDAALRLEPNNISAQDMRRVVIEAATGEHLQQAQSLFAKGQYDNALSECEIVLRFDPQNSLALSLRTRITETKKALGYK